MSRIESGDRTPSREYVDSLVEVLDLTEEEGDFFRVAAGYAPAEYTSLNIRKDLVPLLTLIAENPLLVEKVHEVFSSVIELGRMLSELDNEPSKNRSKVIAFKQVGSLLTNSNNS